LLDWYRTKKKQSIKKELKRILRGHHLPESHPEKPRGFLEQTLARIQATVVTELATLPGYTVRMDNLVPGAVLLAVVVVPTVDMTYYWLGAANRVRESRNCVCSMQPQRELFVDVLFHHRTELSLTLFVVVWLF
jgi:hypothetical protein